MKSKNINDNKRINIITLVIVVGLLLGSIIWRFFELGVSKEFKGHDLSYQSGQELGLDKNLEKIERGTIYDSKGVPLGHDSTTYTVYATINTEEGVSDKNTCAEVLSKYLDLSKDQILSYLDNDHAYQVEFGTAGCNLSLETKEAIEKEGLQGINFTSQVNRHYTNDYFASHLIGFTKSDETEESAITNSIPKGVIGIEAAYDDLLSGRSNYQAGDDSLIGQDLYLTLDSRLQNHLEEIIDENYHKYQPKNIGGYLVEAKTGKLLTSVQRPSFNLNTREGIDKDWRNIMVEEANEPGSTIKILTTAVAKDLNLYSPTETFESGSLTLYDDTVISDFNKVGWGNITYDEGLARSSNTAMVYLVEKMGVNTWVDKLRSFGFSQTTNSRLANEDSGYADFNNDVSKVMSSFGQAFAATDIQLLQAFTSIGNNGKMLKVQYIDHYQDQAPLELEVISQPVSAESCQHVLSVMQDGVEKPYGIAQDFRRDDISVAAKTGTAEIADPEGSGYLTGPYDCYFSVVAFLPAEDPEYMVYLYLKQPTKTNNKTGSKILADIFHPFVDKILVNH